MIVFFDRDSPFDLTHCWSDHARRLWHTWQRSGRPGGAAMVERNLQRALARQSRWYWRASVGGVPERPIQLGWVLNSKRDLIHAIGLKKRGQIRELWAGPNLVVLPDDEPTLIGATEIDRYLVPCSWIADLYAARLSSLRLRLAVWPVGLDTETWAPAPRRRSSFVLVYNKGQAALAHSIRQWLQKAGIGVHQIDYGHYRAENYRALLQKASACVWLSRSETQGLACLEALSMNVPVLAWDPGEYSLHRGRLRISAPASSVPYFDARCGEVFRRFEEWPSTWAAFRERKGTYRPREYVLEKRLDLAHNLEWLPLP